MWPMSAQACLLVVYCLVCHVAAYLHNCSSPADALQVLLNAMFLASPSDLNWCHCKCSPVKRQNVDIVIKMYTGIVFSVPFLSTEVKPFAVMRRGLS